MRSEDDAVAIEDELVLAPDLIHIGDERAVVGGPARHHLLARSPFAGVVWRAVDVDQQVGAVVSLKRHRARRVPAVLADRYADPHAQELEDRAAVALGEIALLVEH